MNLQLGTEVHCEITIKFSNFANEIRCPFLTLFYSNESQDSHKVTEDIFQIEAFYMKKGVLLNHLSGCLVNITSFVVRWILRNTF